ncbi:MAG: SMC-Scp complex subunit ScpB [Pirellulales bacterium]
MPDASSPSDRLAAESSPAAEATAPHEAISVEKLNEAFAEMMSVSSGRDQSVSADPGAPQQGQSPRPDSSQPDAHPVTPQSIVEAVLFVGRPSHRPLPSREMAAIIRGVSPREIDAIVANLNSQYDEDGSAYAIVSEGNGYRMALRESMHHVRDKFFGRNRATRLSQAAIEVLSIVAYNQPVSGDEVNELRGKSSSGILTQLVRRQLAKIERPAEQPRKPIYRTTDRFLRLFGLDSLDDLPRSEDLDKQ